MSSLLEISNKALRKIGVAELNSLTQQGPVADRCNSAVVEAVRSVLRAHNWSFATVWGRLAKRSENPPFGYQHAYQIPRDSVRLTKVQSSESLDAKPVRYKNVRGGIVYTDADPCYAQYVIYDESDLTDAPDDFIEVCAWKLATELCTPLAKSDKIGATLNGYRATLDLAKQTDASEDKPTRVDENLATTILAARDYPSSRDEADRW